VHKGATLGTVIVAHIKNIDLVSGNLKHSSRRLVIIVSHSRQQSIGYLGTVTPDEQELCSAHQFERPGEKGTPIAAATSVIRKLLAQLPIVFKIVGIRIREGMGVDIRNCLCFRKGMTNRVAFLSDNHTPAIDISAPGQRFRSRTKEMRAPDT
jgi:hypothetical protein